ncbi:hypothetical protein [Microbacterium sp. SS28]|uniref:hypothetical protein n=1 Tax=Microbacterium sp. SS28 TaxID=2919948 RepID=UPI001FA98DE0|nr:hypothetical protein [Microbacterium sp. SS28]
MPRRRSPVRPRPAHATAEPRRRCGIAGVLLIALLTSCAPAPSPDPALVALAGEALSATRSAQLGEDQRADGRMFGTTTRALLGDMERKLADVVHKADLHRPIDARDAAYRGDLLAASQDAIDAVQAAAAGLPEAGDELDAAAEQLARLDEQP